MNVVYIGVRINCSRFGERLGRIVRDRSGGICAQVSTLSMQDRRKINALGFSASGTVSNMSVSMFACTAQLALVSLRAVTRTEYRCATVRVRRSIGDSSTSVPST